MRDASQCPSTELAELLADSSAELEARAVLSNESDGSKLLRKTDTFAAVSRPVVRVNHEIEGNSWSIRADAARVGRAWKPLRQEWRPPQPPNIAMPAPTIDANESMRGVVVAAALHE